MNGYDLEHTIFYLNSPTWLPSLKLIKKSNPKTRIIVRSGGNDIMAGWIGNETDMSKNLEDSRARIVEMINGYVDYFIVNSTYSYKRAISVDVNPERIVKVIGGVDCNSFYPKAKYNEVPVKILTAARLVKFKGFEYSLKAVRDTINRGIELQYTIVGDGPEREKIEKIISSNNLSKHVILLGAKRIEDMPKYFRDADIFLHMPIYLEKHERGSSYIHTETMGRCLCEASASALPIVTSKVGGIPEIVKDKETGFLVNERDYITASDKLFKLIKDYEKRIEMGINGRTRTKKLFDWKIIFQQYKEIFK